jgi:hypothetical protein
LPIDDCRLSIEKEWRTGQLSIGNLRSKIGNPDECRLTIARRRLKARCGEFLRFQSAIFNRKSAIPAIRPEATYREVDHGYECKFST